MTAGPLPDLPLTDNNGGASRNSSSNGADDGTGEASGDDRNSNNNREDDAGGDDRTDRDIHYPEDNPPDPDPASNLPLQAEEELQTHM